MNKIAKKVAVLMGGISSEREISLLTGEAVLNAVRNLGYEVIPVLYNDSVKNNLDDLKSVDVVFLALHGGDGENGDIQAFLDDHGIVYTGSGPKSSKLCMDKSKSKYLVAEAGIATPYWSTLKKIDDLESAQIHSYPVIVKPNDQGSTVGLTVAHNFDEALSGVKTAFEYSSEVLVEGYIAGREMTVTVLEGKSYPVVEIIPSHELYDYECKYTSGMSQYICPAEIDTTLRDKLMNEAVLIHNLLGCRDYSRVDFRIDESGKPWFLEVNTLPGMTATSLVPKSLKAAGFSFEYLIDKIIYQALTR